MKDENQLISLRRQKVKALREKGIDPYPYSFPKKHDASFILENYKKLKKGERVTKRFSLAGRLMSLRVMGRASFAHLQDQSGRIQIYIREEDVGKECYKHFTKLDLGDIIGIRGSVFKTKMGELSIAVRSFELLTKSVRPLPEKWHGLKDVELRYRQRHIDLLVNPEVRRVFLIRSKIISLIREFLSSEGFIEVDIPTLQPVYGGANARPFKTHINAWNMNLYLSISPELYLKRLLVGGFERVYTLTKCFRNEGVDRTHNPEFTMLECYMAYADYKDIMKLTEELYEYIAKKLFGRTTINYRGKKIDLKAPWKHLTLKDAIRYYLKINVDKMSDRELQTYLRNNNLEYRGEFSRGLATLLIFEELVEDKLTQPIHILDHPKESTPLCKPKRGNSHLIERFESYIWGMEMGNAYSELNDPELQYELFKDQEERGRGGDEEHHPMDKEYIKALEIGMPPAGGVGIGIDRVIMLFTDSASLRDVILFPTMRPEE